MWSMSQAKQKVVTSVIKLLIKAGQAKPAPPVGPALGQAGLNIMNFCKDFNAKTADFKVALHRLELGRLQWSQAHRCCSRLTGGMPQEDVPVPVKITAYSDKTFTYVRFPAWLAPLPGRARARRPPCTSERVPAADLQGAQEMKTPPATYFIKKALGMEEGSQRPGHTESGVISAKHLYEIAKIKHQDTVRTELQAVCRSLVGTCKSMGVRVVAKPEDV